MDKNTESQLLTRYWTYLAVVIILWLGATGFLLWRLQPLFSPPLTLPATPSIPAIDEGRIEQLQQALNERNSPPNYPSTQGEFRAEPFD